MGKKQVLPEIEDDDFDEDDAELEGLDGVGEDDEDDDF